MLLIKRWGREHQRLLLKVTELWKTSSQQEEVFKKKLEEGSVQGLTYKRD